MHCVSHDSTRNETRGEARAAKRTVLECWKGGRPPLKLWTGVTGRPSYRVGLVVHSVFAPFSPADFYMYTILRSTQSRDLVVAPLIGSPSPSPTQAVIYQWRTVTRR